MVAVAEPPAAYRARSPLVVDSSIVCAVLFDETERAQALERIEGRSLFAPHLLDHEVVHVALKKQRGGWPADSLGLALADYAAYRIEMVDTEEKIARLVAETETMLGSSLVTLEKVSVVRYGHNGGLSQE